MKKFMDKDFLLQTETAKKLSAAVTALVAKMQEAVNA